MTSPTISSHQLNSAFTGGEGRTGKRSCAGSIGNDLPAAGAVDGGPYTPGAT